MVIEIFSILSLLFTGGLAGTAVVRSVKDHARKKGNYPKPDTTIPDIPASKSNRIVSFWEGLDEQCSFIIENKRLGLRETGKANSRWKAERMIEARFKEWASRELYF